MTIGEKYTFLKTALSDISGEEAAYEAKILLAAALNTKTSGIFLRFDELFPGKYTHNLENMLSRRLSGEPIQYILGEWEFMGLSFLVDSRALIPRQDTELLVEVVGAHIQTLATPLVLDLCCGSGCVGVSLAKLYGASVHFSDVSANAISLAKENAEKNMVCGTFVLGDMFENIGSKYDAIACNPPYLTMADMANLQREVVHEPSIALFGGDDGLRFYRYLAANAKKYIKDGGVLAMEVGLGQADDVAALFGEAQVYLDANRIERVVVAKF